MMEKERERCWKTFLDSVFNYSDSCPPGRASVSAVAGYKELMWMLDGCTTTGKWGTILVPSCLAALTFSSSFMQQTARLCICLGGPTAVPGAQNTAVLGTSSGSQGCDALWEHLGGASLLL